MENKIHSNSEPKNQAQETEERLWKNLVNYQYKEFDKVKLKVSSGTIPEDLKGTLFRNTAACLTRNGQKQNHIFDGDGAILKVNFEKGQATGSYKFVQTKSYQREEKEGRYSQQGIHMHKSSCCRRYFTLPDVKNVANTSVLPLTDNRLLCLWEGGMPHSLNKEDLNTIGIDTLNGHLKDTWALSAHYRVDWKSKQIYQYGMDNNKGSFTLNLKCLDLAGNVQRFKRHSFKGRAFVHDFVLAGKYLVFVLPPFYLTSFDIVTTRKTIWGSIKEKPKEGCEIMIFDKDSFELVKKLRTETFMVWHFTNGFVNQSGEIVLEFPLYPDFKVNKFFTDILGGKLQPGTVDSKLHHMIIDIQGEKIRLEKQNFEYACEFPTFDGAAMGQEWDTTYLNINQSQDSSDLFNTIASFSNKTGQQKIYELNNKSVYLGEPVPTPNVKYLAALGIHAGGGDGGSDVSEVHIVNAETMAQECILQLPNVLPISFHGVWDHDAR